MDNETRKLCAVLAERDAIRAQLAANDADLKTALRIWSDRKPGSRGGVATEAGARFILGQSGLL